MNSAWEPWDRGYQPQQLYYKIQRGEWDPDIIDRYANMTESSTNFNYNRGITYVYETFL